MNLLRKFAYILLLVFISVGCKKPNPNPELLDPIYSDLMSNQAAITAKVEAQRKKILAVQAEIDGLPPADPSTKRTIREKYNLERGLVQLEQDALYFQVRAEQRLVYARKSYLEAFNAEKPWPDPEEFKEYEARKKLRQASRNWDDRVPKATQYLRKEPSKAEKKPETASGGH